MSRRCFEVAVLAAAVSVPGSAVCADDSVRLVRPPPATDVHPEHGAATPATRVVAWVAQDAVLVAGARGGVDAADAVAARPVVASSVASLLEQPPPATPLVIAAADDRAADRLGAAVRAAGGEVRWRLPGAGLAQVGVVVPGDRLGAVVAAAARDRATVWVDRLPGARLRNHDSVWRCQSGSPGRTPLFDAGLTGAGQVVAVTDTGLDADHCGFRDDAAGLPAINDDRGTDVSPGHRKLQAVDFLWSADRPPGPTRWDDHGHGTHVAGSVAGDIRGDGGHQGFDGMAPAARLVIQDAGFQVDDCGDLPGLGCPMLPLEPMLEQAYAQGARIHNFSWGDAENARPLNRYTERTADVDRYLRRHPDAVVLVAAGNAGLEGNGTVGSPATGKSVIAVGATTPGAVEPACPAFFTARGWTHDGRVKPDVLAPGTGIWSAATDGWIDSRNCDSRESSGTSMASPTVAGLAALVRQYFADGFHPGGRRRPERGFEPSGALVKAVLIASAVDLSSGCPGLATVPSRQQGWGLVRLDDVLPLPGDPERLVVVDARDRFDAGGQPPDELVVETAGGPLKVVLTWYDEPSSSLATATLVNDLDLEVEGPGGVYRGNVLADGRSLAGGAPDRRDTVEVVILPDTAVGGWTVRVHPHAVPAAPQGYALAVVGDLVDGAPRRPSGRVPGG
jgi:subtilisin family serine protease